MRSEKDASVSSNLTQEKEKGKAAINFRARKRNLLFLPAVISFLGRGEGGKSERGKTVPSKGRREKLLVPLESISIPDNGKPGRLD